MGKYENKVIRSRNFGFILYPENPYHMQYLHYLENYATGFYILHDKNADNFYTPFCGFAEAVQHDEKPHFHCVVQFKNPRTADGVLKSIPTVKYYKPCQLENITNEIKQRFFTVYDVSYLDIPVEEVNKKIVEHIEPISDIYGYAQYMLHKDFKSVMQGKKEYEFTDVNPFSNPIETISDYFVKTDMSDGQIIDIIYQIASCCDGDYNTFVQLCSMYSDQKVIKYVQSHAYFINNFILSPNRRIARKERLYD